ncbi:hypothetical protein SSABA_v1c03000 [Spiroplasma sabaudiense Ar-1343]|uniref:Uncharacterized protein n=1 Tax=Spiroplasma sabaudiense Ar-1343 TaxID=1276257 RepID=W6A9N2_9MOLU|nr:hypothetical protein [Spiroplasma sabaudiense]AHI53712.1 hypothetical protein SSABA_v1c03000 [Spiroplasma sabaudiense Ar-1343]
MSKELKKDKINYNDSLGEESESKLESRTFDFSQNSVDWIYEEKLDSDVNFQKLIKFFDRIMQLEESDPRRESLVSMWVEEINKLYNKHVQNLSNLGKSSKGNIKKSEPINQNKSNIDGWKERLNIKDRSSSTESMREQLMRKLNSSELLSGRDTKEDIMYRAGQTGERKEVKLSYIAKGRNAVEEGINEIDNILYDIENTAEFEGPGSILNNSIKAERDYSSAVGFTVDLDEVAREKAEDEFNFDGDSANPSEVEITGDVKEFEEIDFSQIKSPVSKTIDGLDLTNAIDINYETIEFNEEEIPEPIFTKTSDPTLQEIRYQENEFDIEKREEEYSKINPEKRNILDKSDFAFFDRDKDATIDKSFNAFQHDFDHQKPFHEIKPVGSYGMIYDSAKQPSMHNLINEYKKDNEVMDEMNDKIEFLRDLRNERKHRVNLMHIERNNSYIVARANRLRENREKNRLKQQEAINLKALERQERLRRLQERQKLIQLMKERQMKRSEEKRVASILQLERERRLAKNAKYRDEIASIDAQIRHEQEMIKNTELKMKSYFTKTSDPKLFDESLKIAREFSKYAVSDEKIIALQKMEEDKRQKRIERLSKKFTKNKK